VDGEAENGGEGVGESEGQVGMEEESEGEAHRANLDQGESDGDKVHSSQKESSMTRGWNLMQEEWIVKMKATSRGHYLVEEGELLPLNRRDLKIITMLMELKKMRNLAKQGNKG